MSEMNHGVVMFRRDATESRIWEMAMRRGQFIAIYTERRMERSADGSDREPWSSTIMPTTGESLRFSLLPDLEGRETDYARYEPAYDDQFLKMCQYCAGYGGAPTVALPATASDEGALRLLGAMGSIYLPMYRYLYERFYVVPRRNLRNPERSPIELSRLMRPILPIDGWAYFLGFLCKDSVVVFLSIDESDVEGLFEPAAAGRTIMRRAAWLYEHGVIEKW
jgi:hypothetical protein